MSIINLKFKNQPVLVLSIDQSDVGQQYYNLVKSNYTKQKPVYRDIKRYTLEYMIPLIQQANEIFGWGWSNDDLKNNVMFHKGVEVLLGKTKFKNVPAEYDELLHELHYGLHVIQDTAGIRSGWLQVEWYDNEGFELDYSFEFKTRLNFGDVKLQNPFVGHGPLQIYYENDVANISQTCKFHNFVKPGINVAVTEYEEVTFKDKIIEMFKQHDPKFVNLHGEEKIKHYIGYPVIGRVLNLDDLQTCNSSPLLEFESLSFED